LGFGVYVYELGRCWVFLIFLLKTTNFNYQKGFKNQPNPIKKNFTFKRINEGFKNWRKKVLANSQSVVFTNLIIIDFQRWFSQTSCLTFSLVGQCFLTLLDVFLLFVWCIFSCYSMFFYSLFDLFHSLFDNHSSHNFNK